MPTTITALALALILTNRKHDRRLSMLADYFFFEIYLVMMIMSACKAWQCQVDLGF